MKVTIRNGECKHVVIHRYPDGQKNVTLDMSWFNNPKEPVHIDCNIRDFDDLELLLCVIAALRKHDFAISYLRFLYLFGLRSDRSFETGMPNYLRDVLAPIIKMLRIQRINIMTPHSNLVSVHMNANYYTKYPSFEGYIVIGADEGAYERQDSFPMFTFHFHKIRLSGEISVTLKEEFYSKIKDLPDHLPILIVDDLCDGGGTFIAIAEWLKEHFPERKRHLYICHGLFTKGVDHVAAHYDKIITTNSYQDFESHPKLQVLDVWS